METKAHTVKRFDAELEELNNNVVKMASAVEEQLGRLGDALVNLNATSGGGPASAPRLLPHDD